MKVVEVVEKFGLENMKFAERPTPEPAKGQLLLGLRAASLNYRDWLTVRGEYNPRQPLPLIPCSDGVGEVLELGAGVTRVARGDRVLPIFAQRWIGGRPTHEKLRSTLGGPLDGVLAERMVVDAESVVRAPAHLTDEEAACLPCAALTAWNALTVQGEIRSGDSVLVQGSGGVSLFALIFARALGATVYAISSRDERLARMRELGAVESWNYREEPDWGRAVRKKTGGVDLVIDVGGATTLPQSLAAVGIGGRICQVGNLGGGRVEIDLIQLFMKQVRLQGLLVGDRDSFETMNAWIEKHELRPIVDRVFSWSSAIEAFEYMASGEPFGKVCLRIDEV